MSMAFRLWSLLALFGSAATAQPVATVFPKPARVERGYAWEYPASRVIVEAEQPQAAPRILEALLDLEAHQRGFFASVPEYRIEFARISLLESFGIPEIGRAHV